MYGPDKRSEIADDTNKVLRQRYGPHERAGTFEVVAASKDVIFGPDMYCLMEFAVWKTVGGSGHRRQVLWFKSHKKMTAAAATSIRALEVWTDCNDRRFPFKVVLLKK